MPPRGPLITPAELDEWHRVYPTGGAAAVQALFPHRSKNCINVTAHRRGIKIADLPAFQLKHMRGIAKCRRHSRNSSTTEHDAILREFYTERGAGFIMWLLPMRTHYAIRARAYVLGIQKPQKAARPGRTTPRRDRLAALFAVSQVSA